MGSSEVFSETVITVFCTATHDIRSLWNLCEYFVEFGKNIGIYFIFSGLKFFRSFQSNGQDGGKRYSLDRGKICPEFSWQVGWGLRPLVGETVVPWECERTQTAHTLHFKNFSWKGWQLLGKCYHFFKKICRFLQENFTFFAGKLTIFPLKIGRFSCKNCKIIFP